MGLQMSAVMTFSLQVYLVPSHYIKHNIYLLHPEE